MVMSVCVVACRRVKTRLPKHLKILGNLGPLFVVVFFSVLDYAFGKHRGLMGHGGLAYGWVAYGGLAYGWLAYGGLVYGGLALGS